MHHRFRNERAALTLIELIVAISIMTVLLTLVAIYVVPAFQDNKNVVRGSDRITTALLIAKQRALRDQAPRGVRFVLDDQSVYGRLQYIETPSDFREGSITVTPPAPTVIPIAADVQGGAATGAFDDYLVQPGDWLRIEEGTPMNFQIASVTAGSPAGSLTLYNAVPTPVAAQTRTTTNYRIIRSPRPIAGEASIDLPQNVVAGFGAIANIDARYNPPARTINLATVYEIVFSPSGGVINRGGNAMIVLLVHDSTAASPLEANTTQLLAINPRTGQISAHPVGRAGHPPLEYALDGRSSGL